MQVRKSIAEYLIFRGKSGLHGTTHWLTAIRGNPMIRATVTKAIKFAVKRAISVCSNLKKDSRYVPIV